MFSSLRHLLPDSLAWRVIVERTLKKYLRGLADVGTDAVAFIDDVSDDLYPQLTRELAEWQTQWNLAPVGSEQVQRDWLEYNWATPGSQSPRHVQDYLNEAGFDAYVYDWMDAADVSLSRVYGDEFDVSTQASDPGGFCFASGGKKMYVVEKTANTIYQYSLAEEYNPGTATYDSKSFVVTTQDTDPQDVFITWQGDKMFVLGASSDSIHEYSLSTPFDVSTAAAETSHSVTSQDTAPISMAWKTDGTSVYVLGSVTPTVYQYDLTTAFDLSGTVTYNQSHASGLTNPRGIAFSQFGDRLYFCDNDTPDAVYQHNLSTQWDIGTASSSGLSVNVGATISVPSALEADHGFLFLLNGNDDSIYRYLLGGPRNPIPYITQPTIGNTLCGEPGTDPDFSVAQCGEQPPGQTSDASAVCSVGFAGADGYLVNRTLSLDYTPRFPVSNATGGDETLWGQLWYVGGTPFGTGMVLAEDERDRFEKLLLKLGPAEKWIVTIYDLWSTTLLGSWVYEDAADTLDSGEWQFTVTTTTPLKIHDTDDDGVDQSAALATVASGDRLRFTKTNGEWIEYVTTGAAVDNTTYYSVAFNTTPTRTSTDWSGLSGLMQVHLWESI